MIRSSRSCTTPKAQVLPRFHLGGNSIYWPDSEKPPQERPWAEMVLLAGWRLPVLRAEPPGRVALELLTSSESGPSFPACKPNTGSFSNGVKHSLNVKQLSLFWKMHVNAHANFKGWFINRKSVISSVLFVISQDKLFALVPILAAMAVPSFFCF